MTVEEYESEPDSYEVATTGNVGNVVIEIGASSVVAGDKLVPGDGGTVQKLADDPDGFVLGVALSDGDAGEAIRVLLTATTSGGANRSVHWDTLQGVPEGFADGVDNVGFHRLRANDGSWLLDSVTFVDGTNVTLTQIGDTIKIDAATGGEDGWTDDGANVHLTTSTDNVGIGTESPSQKVHIASPSTDAAIAFSVGASELSLGPNPPSSAVSDNSNGGTIVWNNPTNCFSDDGSYAYATMSASATSEYLKASGFGFAIPSYATIMGIEVKVGRFATDVSAMKDNAVKLVKSGAVVGDNKALPDYWPTTEAVATYGGSSDLWGTAWLPSDINASNFGIVISVDGFDVTFARIDYITIKVYYGSLHDWALGADPSDDSKFKISKSSSLGTDDVFALDLDGNASFTGTVSGADATADNEFVTKGQLSAGTAGQWATSGDDIYNTNTGNVGIGTTSPTAQLHTTGTVRFEGAGTPDEGFVLTSDATGNATWQKSDFSQLVEDYPCCISGAYMVGEASTGGSPSSVAVSGNYAYVVNTWSDNMMIYDVSSPSSPTLIATIATGNDPYSVAVSGNYAYVVNYYSDNMMIYNVSSPSSPTLIATIATERYPRSVAVSVNYAYVLNASSNNMMIYDVSSPSSPTLIATIATGDRPLSMAFSGNYAYVACFYANKLQIFKSHCRSGTVIVSGDDISVTDVVWQKDGNDIYNTNTGNVGIGTASPTVKLHIHSPISENNSRLKLTNDVTETGGGDGFDLVLNIDNDAYIIQRENKNMIFRTNDMNRVIISNNGNVGIVTSSPGYRLDVDGYIRSSGEVISRTQSRIIGDAHGLITRIDGSDTYLLLTDSGDQYGSWNGFRPFRIVNSTGDVYLAAGAAHFRHSDGHVGFGISDPGSCRLYVYNESNTATYSRSESGIGVRGVGTTYDFYAAGSGTNYGPFTGAHEVILPPDFPSDFKPGMLVSVTGENKLRKDEKQNPSISSTMATVKLSDTPNDPKAFGAIVFVDDTIECDWYTPKPGERIAAVNALGEGRMWVCDINGEINAGDLITSSSVPGYGMLQSDDIVHSYTVAKCVEDASSCEIKENIIFDGKTYKAYLIAVVYMGG